MGLCYWRVCFKVKSLSCVHLFVSPWIVAHQASPSMGFSRQEYWSGLPFPSPGDLPTQESNPALLHWRQTLYPLSQQGRRVCLLQEHTCQEDRAYPGCVSSVLEGASYLCSQLHSFLHKHVSEAVHIFSVRIGIQQYVWGLSFYVRKYMSLRDFFSCMVFGKL